MDYTALKFIGVGLMAIAMMGAAIGVGNIFAALLNGVARNPAAEGKMKNLAFIGAAFAELMGLLAFVIAMIILN